MKKLILYISILISVGVFGQEDLFNAGNQAYAEENYDLAIESYNQVIAQDIFSTELYYNLGNAYYRNGDLGEAIWAYEVSLKIDPSNEDAKSNLKFAGAKTVDRIDSHRPGLGSWLIGLLFGPMINVWAWISIAASFLLGISFVMFFKAKGRKGRNLGMFVGTSAALLLIFSLMTAHFHKASLMTKTEAVIVNEKVEIKISPLESATKSFELNEGTKVNILDENGEWSQIEVNGNTGWLENMSLWEI